MRVCDISRVRFGREDAWRTFGGIGIEPPAFSLASQPITDHRLVERQCALLLAVPTLRPLCSVTQLLDRHP